MKNLNYTHGKTRKTIDDFFDKEGFMNEVRSYK